jgi:hypothetical protein
MLIDADGQTVFDSFITNNIVNALASNALLAVSAAFP